MALLEERNKRARQNKLKSLYPDDGEFKRDLYVKHLEFFRSGAKYRERCLMAANRVGKTFSGAYEIALHLTGIYPDWWEGRRFDEPVSAWACGDTAETVRDIGQLELLGNIDEIGTGMIPAHTIIGTPPRKPGIPDAIELVNVRHITGGISTVGFKGYAKGRKSFQGTAKHIIWLDEEPEQSIYAECLLRTMTVNGMILATFTPLSGLSDVVLSFMPGGQVKEGVTI